MAAALRTDGPPILGVLDARDKPHIAVMLVTPLTALAFDEATEVAEKLVVEGQTHVFHVVSWSLSDFAAAQIASTVATRLRMSLHSDLRKPCDPTAPLLDLCRRAIGQSAIDPAQWLIAHLITGVDEVIR